MIFDLTDAQLAAISAIERACSVLSLVGCVLTMATFCASKSFHKPINRLVFYASFGNMLSNVGTLMSQAYIHIPLSPQCQFQAFLIQMFMPADAFWTLAMAVNVYLTFYHKFDAAGLRKMEVPYLIICYGIPFVPALTYLWVSREGYWKVYGDATLWCWISDEWEILRIATFYGPVWLCIVITFIIYIRTGRTIYEKRRELHKADSLNSDSLNNGCGSTKTTDISVTTKRAEDSLSNLEMHNAGQPRSFDAPNEHYTVTITAEPQKRGRFLPTATCAFMPGGMSVPYSPQSVRFNHRELNVERNPQQRANPNAHRKVYERNNAAWSYTKCSILFFIAILITWVPSSANRVFSVIHKQGRSAPLEFMSAFVLPLQGFWNAVIYFVTSWGACKSLWKDIRGGKRPEVCDLVVGRSRKNAGGDTQEDQRELTSPTIQIPLSTLSPSCSESTQRLAERDTSDDGKLSC